VWKLQRAALTSRSFRVPASKQSSFMALLAVRESYARVLQALKTKAIAHALVKPHAKLRTYLESDLFEKLATKYLAYFVARFYFEALFVALAKAKRQHLVGKLPQTAQLLLNATSASTLVQEPLDCT
jgi:hypothetical protein